MTGDFSKYPEVLRDVMPYLQGEVCELRANWNTFHFLFMADADRAKLFGQYLDTLLWNFQRLLQDEILVTIARLTDLDSNKQKNLSFWSLVARCEIWNPSFAGKIRIATQELANEASAIRAHRHKRLAHFDLPTSVGQSALPAVPFTKVFDAIERCEVILNLVSKEAENSTMIFRILDHRDVLGNAEITVYKAAAYDAAEAAGKIEQLAWRAHIPGRTG